MTQPAAGETPLEERVEGDLLAVMAALLTHVLRVDRAQEIQNPAVEPALGGNDE